MTSDEASTRIELRKLRRGEEGLPSTNHNMTKNREYNHALSLNELQ
jgi:hypothetical protein